MKTAAPGSTPSPGIALRCEVYVWCFAMIAICLLTIHGINGKLFNDSYQYLSIARNLQSRGEIATSIIEFDTERSKETIPAPATTVAPGYPIAIRLLRSAHISFEHAGLLVALAGMVGVVPLLWWCSKLLGASLNMQRAAVLIWIVNAEVIIHATSLLSEGLFTLIVLSGVALLLYDEKNDRAALPPRKDASSRADSNQFALPLGTALIGLSYWVRYAGLLFVAALIVYTAYQVLYRRNRILLRLSSLACCFGVVACGMIRNAKVAGTWKGGNDLIVHTPLVKVLHDTVSIGYQLLFGPARAHLSLGMLVWLAAVLAVALLLRKASFKIAAWPNFPMLLFLLVSVYVAGMVYLGMTTMIIYNFSPRYFLPVLPELILLGVALTVYVWQFQDNAVARRAIKTFAAIALCAYIAQNVFEMRRFEYPHEYVLMSSYYAEPAQDGTQLADWVKKNIAPDSVVLATDGQASAYTLHLPTISLVSPRMSHGKWDEDQIRQTMSAFHAKYLITYPGIPDDSAPEQRESPFLNRLVHDAPPAWLVLAAHNSHVEIFEDTDGTAPISANVSRNK